MHVSRRPKLGRERAAGNLMRCLRRPYPLPPALVIQVRPVLRSARIWHLRALFIPDARMDMQRTSSTEADNVRLIVQQPLADQNPVAEFGTQTHAREMFQQPLRDPGVIENAAAMCLAHLYRFLLEAQCLREERVRFLFAEGVLTAMGIDKQWVECRCLLKVTGE